MISQGVTRRTAPESVRTHTAEVIRQQVAWQPYRPQVKRAAGVLVQAIRDAWPPPPALTDAQEHAATVGRQADRPPGAARDGDRDVRLKGKEDGHPCPVRCCAG